MDKKMQRQLFLQEIELSVEQEYNAPGKPELVENTNKEAIKQKLEKIIGEFCTRTNSSKTDNIKYLLERINEKRGVNPSSKEEFNVIEEVLYNILAENESER